MIRINLIPTEIESVSAPTLISPAVPVGIVAAASFVIIGLMYTVQQKNQRQLQIQEDDLNNKLQRYQPLIAEVDSVEQAKQQLTNRKSVIQQLESDRLRYPQFMDDFIKLLPGNLWLNNLTTTLAAQANTMTVGMDVTALDNYAIADLIANLETSQIFTNVELGPITAVQAAAPATGQTMTFHVNTTYRKLNLLTDATKQP